MGRKMVSNKKYREMQDKYEKELEWGSRIAKEIHELRTYKELWEMLDETLDCQKTIIFEREKVTVRDIGTGIEGTMKVQYVDSEANSFRLAMLYALKSAKNKHKEYLDKCVADKVKEENKQG